MRTSNVNFDHRHSIPQWTILIFAFLFNMVSTTTRTMAAEPVIFADFTTGETKGIKKIAWRTDGTTTYYDATSDRLVDGTAGQPRPDKYPGNPKGKNHGIVLETAACNNLFNSSFENELGLWHVTGLNTRIVEGGLHGKKAAVVNGTGELYQRLEGLTPKAYDKAVYGCLSVYIQGDVKAWQKVVSPFVCIVENDKRGPNLVWEIQHDSHPGSRWTRLTAFFAIPGDFGETFRYDAGLEVTGAADLKLDAAQLEVRGTFMGTKERWVSSYIPTSDQRRSRYNESADLLLDQSLDMRKGTMAVWYYETNPTAMIGTLLQTPYVPGKSIQLAGASAVLGKTSINRRPFAFSNDPPAWHLFALTWRDGEGVYYVDGKEASVYEGPFPYKDDGLQSVTKLFLGKDVPQDDPEGCISWAAVYAEPLSSAEIAQLYGLAVSSATSAKAAGIPVEFVVPVTGRVSVGVYDKQGALLRQIVMGEKMEAGKHTALWDGKDDDGQPVAAGHYEVRGVVNSITCEYRMGIGNTGSPPWGPSKVCEGIWVGIARSGDRLAAAAPCGEFCRIIQCFTADGKVVWTANTMPFGGQLCTLAADDQFFYVAGVITSEFDANGSLYFSDTLYRLNAKDGSYAPWPGQGNYIRIPSAKRKAPEGPIPTAVFNLSMYRGDQRLSNPFPWFGVRGMTVFDGKLYVSMFHENRILILDATTCTSVGEIRDIPQPQGVAVNNGLLYVASKNSILRYDLKVGNRSVLASGFSAPYGVAVGPHGDVYVSDLGESQQVKIIDANGKVKNTIGRQWTEGPNRDGRTDRLFLPCSLVVDKQGNLTVGDYGNSQLVYFDTAGRRMRTTEAYGHGGNNGGVRFLPGDSTRLLTDNIATLPWNMTHMLLYELDMKKGTWRSTRRYQDISPVLTCEPMFIRRLENGRTYVYLGGYMGMTVWELMRDQRLEFCCAFLAPAGPLSCSMKPEIAEDAKAAGLVGEGKGIWGTTSFRCRAVWTDHNRNGRMEKDEVILDDTQTSRWTNGGDLYVDPQGNMLVQNQNEGLKGPISQLLRSGFDAIGNPLYDWKTTRQVLDLSKHAWLGKEGLDDTRARVMDKQGNVYASFQQGGNGCTPTKVRLAKFAPDGRVLWKFGHKSVGFKDHPGEFDCVDTMPAILDDILYVADYSSPMDLLTTDGLYLTTLLKAGGVIEEDQYSYCGENFWADVVKDAKTKKVYFVINPHCFVLPCFEVLGLDTVKRFEAGKVVLDERMRSILRQTSQEGPKVQGPDIVYLIDRALAVDGDLADWQGIPEKTSVKADEADEARVRYRYACNGKTLFMGFSVKDPTPAINPLKGPENLWHGDCLEFYFGRDPQRAATWKPGDFILHVAASAMAPEGKATAGIGEIVTKAAWVMPSDLKTATKIWPDRQGYDLEVGIPLKLLGMDGMPAGTRLLMDWDFIYGSAKTQAEAESGDWRFKVARDQRIDGNKLLGGTVLWNYARAVRSPGEENTVYSWSGWNRMPVQAENKIEGVEDQYSATLKVAHDDKGLRFFTEVRDPNPGIFGAAGTGFIGMGDWMEVFVDGQDIYAVATAAYPTPYLVKGNQPNSIAGGTSVIRKEKASYTLEVFVPWAAVGGKKDRYTFNWRTGWSDVSGGAVFGQRLYRPENQPTTLVVMKRDSQATAPISKGQRVFSCGHSFHYFVPPILDDMAKKAGFSYHQVVGLSAIGGSHVSQHWNVPDEQNKAKVALRDGKVDVLTLSPLHPPDDGIMNFAKLGLEYNPNLRITVEEIWMPFDLYQPTFPVCKFPEKVDHNTLSGPELWKLHEPYFKNMDAYIRDLNKSLDKTVLFVVPAGQAVITMREKIIAGQVPGLKTQEDLFTDPVGHPQPPLQALVSYCHFAVIYRRSPVGLPMPAILATSGKPNWDAKLNRLLQEIAWDAVLHHPLSGVKVKEIP